MVRPKRLYKTSKDKPRYYYIIKGRRRYIKVPEGMSQKQVVKINIKNVASEGRRIKKRKKRINVKYEKPIAEGMKKIQVSSSTLPIYFFEPQKKFINQAEILASSQPKIEEVSSEDLKKITKYIEDAKVTSENILKSIEDTKLKLITPVKSLPSKKKVKFDRIKQILKNNKSKETTPAITPLPTPLYEEEYIEGGPYYPEELLGKGNPSINEGLYNDQIENVLKKRIKDFVPVIPSDKSSEMLEYIRPNMKRFGFIINTNPSTSDGSGNDGYEEGHWRACYFNNEDDFTSAEYFDPLAEGNPESSLLNTMKEIAQKMNPEKYFLLKINNLKRQPDGTATCGWHSVKFLDDRFQGVPWDEASGYNNYINKNRPDDSVDGEKQIKKYFQKFKSYL